MSSLYAWTYHMALLLVALSVAAGGCGTPVARESRTMDQLLAHLDENAARHWFLELLRSNGVEEAFQGDKEMTGSCERGWKVEAAHVVAGCNGLVYVQIRPDPDNIENLLLRKEFSSGPRRSWFFFDRSGHLLAWSGAPIGWFLEDISGLGTKDLLVRADSPDGKSRRVPGGPGYYLFFSLSQKDPSPVLLGKGPANGICYAITPIHLPNDIVPLVMTFEERNPLEVKAAKHDKYAHRGYTVVRSFRGGKPTVVLVARGLLELCTGPSGTVALRNDNPHGTQDVSPKLIYNSVTRGFELERKEGQTEEILVFYSAEIPQ